VRILGISVVLVVVLVLASLSIVAAQEPINLSLDLGSGTRYRTSLSSSQIQLDQDVDSFTTNPWTRTVAPWHPFPEPGAAYNSSGFMDYDDDVGGTWIAFQWGASNCYDRDNAANCGNLNHANNAIADSVTPPAANFQVEVRANEQIGNQFATGWFGVINCSFFFGTNQCSGDGSDADYTTNGAATVNRNALVARYVENSGSTTAQVRAEVYFDDGTTASSAYTSAFCTFLQWCRLEGTYSSATGIFSVVVTNLSTNAIETVSVTVDLTGEDLRLNSIGALIENDGLNDNTDLQWDNLSLTYRILGYWESAETGLRSRGLLATKIGTTFLGSGRTLCNSCRWLDGPTEIERATYTTAISSGAETIVTPAILTTGSFTQISSLSFNVTLNGDRAYSPTLVHAIVVLQGDSDNPPVGGLLDRIVFLDCVPRLLDIRCTLKLHPDVAGSIMVRSDWYVNKFYEMQGEIVSGRLHVAILPAPRFPATLANVSVLIYFDNGQSGILWQYVLMDQTFLLVLLLLAVVFFVILALFQSSRRARARRRGPGRGRPREDLPFWAEVFK